MYVYVCIRKKRERERERERERVREGEREGGRERERKKIVRIYIRLPPPLHANRIGMRDVERRKKESRKSECLSKRKKNMTHTRSIDP
jgi:hypothetical protein